MKFKPLVLALPLVGVMFSQQVLAAEFLNTPATGEVPHPVVPNSAASIFSQTPQNLTSNEFLAANISLVSVTPQLPAAVNLDPVSVAISRADRASFKQLLAGRGINYITDADLSSLESGVSDAELNVRGYLLSISKSRVAIAFMGGKITANGYEDNTKVAVFKSKVKQYELDYPYVTNFDGFQMAFTKDGRLAVEYYDQIVVETAKTDSAKRVIERATDLYLVDGATGAATFQYNRILRFDQATHRKTQEITTFYNLSDQVDKQVQTFYYGTDGEITGDRIESYKGHQLVWTSFEGRAPVPCGQPVLCSRATSYTRTDYAYYGNGRFKETVTLILDPDTNLLIRETLRRFANNSYNALTYQQVIENNKTTRTDYFYHGNGVLSKTVTFEDTAQDGITTERTITEKFDLGGVRTERTVRTTEGGTLKSNETLTYYNAFVGGQQAVKKQQVVLYENSLKISDTTVNFSRQGSLESTTIILYVEAVRSHQEIAIFVVGQLKLKIISTYNAKGHLVRTEVLYF